MGRQYGPLECLEVTWSDPILSISGHLLEPDLNELFADRAGCVNAALGDDGSDEIRRLQDHQQLEIEQLSISDRIQTYCEINCVCDVRLLAWLLYLHVNALVGMQSHCLSFCNESTFFAALNLEVDDLLLDG